MIEHHGSAGFGSEYACSAASGFDDEDAGSAAFSLDDGGMGSVASGFDDEDAGCVAAGPDDGGMSCAAPGFDDEDAGSAVSGLEAAARWKEEADMTEEQQKEIKNRLTVLTFGIIFLLAVFLLVLATTKKMNTIWFPIGTGTLLALYWVVADVLPVIWLRQFEDKTESQKRSYYIYAGIDAVGLAGLLYFIMSLTSMTGALVYVVSVFAKKRYHDEYLGISQEQEETPAEPGAEEAAVEAEAEEAVAEVEAEEAVAEVEAAEAIVEAGAAETVVEAEEAEMISEVEAIEAIVEAEAAETAAEPEAEAATGADTKGQAEEGI